MQVNHQAERLLLLESVVTLVLNTVPNTGNLAAHLGENCPVCTPCTSSHGPPCWFWMYSSLPVATLPRLPAWVLPLITPQARPSLQHLSGGPHLVTYLWVSPEICWLQCEPLRGLANMWIFEPTSGICNLGLGWWLWISIFSKFPDDVMLMVSEPHFEVSQLWFGYKIWTKDPPCKSSRASPRCYWEGEELLARDLDKVLDNTRPRPWRRYWSSGPCYSLLPGYYEVVSFS